MRWRSSSLEHRRNRIERCVCCLVQVAIKLIRFAKCKTAQHLSRVFPERGADLGNHHVPRLHLPDARKLARHTNVRRRHRGDANVVNDIGCAQRDVCAFDEVTQLAFVQSGSQSIAQRRHAKIAEMRADPQPVQFFGRLHLAQPNIIAIEALQFSKFRRQPSMLLRADRPNNRHAILPRAALFQHFDRCVDGRLAAPRNIGLVGENLRLWCMIDVLHKQRIALVRREHTGGLGGHRPLRQPLHD